MENNLRFQKYPDTCERGLRSKEANCEAMLYIIIRLITHVIAK